MNSNNAPVPNIGPRTPFWNKTNFGIYLLAILAFAVTYLLTRSLQQPATTIVSTAAPAEIPSGMVWIPGGEFIMGSSDPSASATERPARRIKLDGFFMDETEVTNAQFQAFVTATGYITTAEKKPDWEELRQQLPPGTPKPPEDKLVAGSLVFTPPLKPVPTSPENVGMWWTWTPGANWKNPEGPGSNLAGRENHPVVQVSWEDALAYAKWAGKRLPTEAEWEHASRGGLEGKRYTWGDEPLSDTVLNRANIWQGRFPDLNLKGDKWERTSPVKTFPANGYGLYDVAGNVWEWCSDWFRADAYEKTTGTLTNPQGPKDSWDPMDPHMQKRVVRGGSFLCHINYCESYRNTARRGTTPDTGMSHTGFRCAKSK